MFKNKIKDLRIKNNYTQEELANKIHISRQSISKWENGLSYPTKQSLEMLCEIFNVKISELLDEDELALISIDNYANIKTKNKSLFLYISVGLSSLIILIVSLIIIFNNRLNNLSGIATAERIPLTETVIGYAILDSNGLALYRNYDDKYVAFDDFIESKNYPFEYIEVYDNIKTLKDNKIYSSATNYNEKKESISSKILIKDSDNFNYLNITYIIYNTESNDYYLQFDINNIYLGNITKYSRNFSIYYNEILKFEYNFNIEIEKVNATVVYKLYEYSHDKILIKETEITNATTLTLDVDTVYFIIYETKIDKNNESYLNKITVQHSDFDNIYNYVIQKFDTNSFATYQLVLINSYIYNP